VQVRFRCRRRLCAEFVGRGLEWNSVCKRHHCSVASGWGGAEGWLGAEGFRDEGREGEGKGEAGSMGQG
jgi:hypothetical protein